ncbi:MAG: transglycosylase domain-containing protein [Frankia sp.]
MTTPPAPPPRRPLPEEPQRPLPEEWRRQLGQVREARVGGSARPPRDSGDRNKPAAHPAARRRIVRVAVGLLAVVVTVALAFGLLLVLTPSVSDAAARVRQRAELAGAPLLRGPLPAKVVDALIATEDSRFYSHSGIDLRGAARGLVGPIFSGGDQGGATLDQQLVKILYTGGRRTIVDRIEQVGLAVKLDAHFSKAEILRMYLDTVYFGHGYTGVSAAASGYFGRAPAALTWAQASMLAGLVQAPSVYDPLRNLPAARERQQHVLDRLVAAHKLSRAEAAATYRAPLGLS